MEDEARLLAVGDIHLGRVPARVPSDLPHAALLTPVAAWQAVVERAVADGVHAVLLAGDVVEAPDDFFEAYTALDTGIRRLLAAGVDVVAVAGNHDVGVLPRLADAIPGFRLLGRGGRWECVTVGASRGRPARVLGWSFPQARHLESPFAAPPVLGSSSLPTVGLLHCEVDGGHASPYAPVRRTELDSVPVVAWLLGHVHAPGVLTGPRPVGYLGSLVGLDFTEDGPHGPWLVRVGPDGCRARQLPLSPLRWETVSVDVATLSAADGLEGAVVAAIEAAHVRVAAHVDRPRAVGLRLRVVGEHVLGRELHDAVARLDVAALRPCRDGTVYFVERLIDDSRPARDLAALAAGADPPALLARRLLLLDGPDVPERRALVARGRERLQRERGRAAYQALGPTPLDDAAVLAWLRRAGVQALDALLAQREGGA